MKTQLVEGTLLSAVLSCTWRCMGWGGVGWGKSPGHLPWLQGQVAGLPEKPCWRQCALHVQALELSAPAWYISEPEPYLETGIAHDECNLGVAGEL